MKFLFWMHPHIFIFLTAGAVSLGQITSAEDYAKLISPSQLKQGDDATYIKKFKFKVIHYF